MKKKNEKIPYCPVLQKKSNILMTACLHSLLPPNRPVTSWPTPLVGTEPGGHKLTKLCLYQKSWACPIAEELKNIC